MRYKERLNNDKDGHKEEIFKLENEIKSVDEQTEAYGLKCNSHQKILDEVKDEIKVSESDCLFMFVPYISLLNHHFHPQLITHSCSSLD